MAKDRQRIAYGREHDDPGFDLSPGFVVTGE